MSRETNSNRIFFVKKYKNFRASIMAGAEQAESDARARERKTLAARKTPVAKRPLGLAKKAAQASIGSTTSNTLNSSGSATHVPALPLVVGEIY